LQSSQVLLDDAPVTSEYVPLGHSKQTQDFAIFEYFPAMQSTHDDAALAPDVARYFPAMHDTHDDAPVTAEYVPQGHSKQRFDALLPGNIRYE
jgi:hypothetical protein